MSEPIERGLMQLALRSKVARWLLGAALVVLGWLGAEIRELVIVEGTAAGLVESAVVEIVDGDTIVVEYHGPAVDREVVRLLCVNTPERGEALYEAASGAMAELVGGRKVRLEFEIEGEPARGSFGRLLCYVFADEVNVNVELVRRGFSRYWTKYGRSRYEEDFQEAEAEARRETRGIWALPERERP